MWFLWAFLSALFKGIAYLFRKEALIENHHLHTIPILSAFFAVPLLGTIALVFGRGQEQNFSATFFLLLIINGILGTLAVVSSYKAFRYGELSQIVPLITLLPILLIFTSWFLLGEFPPPLGLAGIILIFAGSFISHVQQANIHFLKPFLEILKDKSNRYMLLTVVIWSISTNIDKVALRYVSPPVWIFLLMLTISIFMSLVYRPSITKMKSVFKEVKIPIIGIGVLGALAVLFQTIAINGAYLSYVLAVKNFDVIIAVILAHLFLREHNFKKRFEGAVLMVIGAVLIGLA